MKITKSILVVVCICIIIVSLPFLVTFLMNKGVFKFASGQTDSWILFWGSYIGVIIGSVMTYVVSKHQIEREIKQQTDDIRNESEASYQKEIEAFQLRNKITKLDSMINISNDLYMIIKKILDEMCFVVEQRYQFERGVIQADIDEYEEVIDKKIESISEKNNQSLLRLRKLKTLSNYSRETMEDLNALEELFNEMDKEIGILINIQDGYKTFIKESQLGPHHIEIPSLKALNRELPKYTVYNLRSELKKHLNEVSDLAGIRIVWENIQNLE